MTKYYFSASWCAPCKVLKPKIIDSGKAILIMDVDQHQDLAKKYNIRSVPTVVIADDNGLEVQRASGVDKIVELLGI